ncbi:MAG: S-layer homology domain-containing protein [Tissierellia bacterium]|nr:S-layer homology domain-containing protein [Tissierellia bacterium]
MKRIWYKIFLLILLITFFCLQIHVYSAEEDNTNSYFLKEARQLEKLSILKGDRQGNLMLHETLTRQDLVIIIIRLHGEEVSKEVETENSEALPFKDVKPSAYYYPYILRSVELGFVQGIRNDTFGVNMEVTAKEVETILLRLLGYEEEAKNWDLIDTLSETLGIRDEINLKNNRTITRGELAKMITNALQVQRKGSTLKLKDVLNIK